MSSSFICFVQIRRVDFLAHVLFQQHFLSHRFVKRTSSSASMVAASTPICSATTSTTVRTTARTKSTAWRKVRCNTPFLLPTFCPTPCKYQTEAFSVADSGRTECSRNVTMCGDGDEAHCVVNGTVSFCSCKPGFQPRGRNRCEGTLCSEHFGVFLLQSASTD